MYLLSLMISNNFSVTLFNFFSQLDLSWTGRGKFNIYYYSTIVHFSSMHFVIFHFVYIKVILFNIQIFSWIYLHNQSSLCKVFKDITLKNVCIRRLIKIVKLELPLSSEMIQGGKYKHLSFLFCRGLFTVQVKIRFLSAKQIWAAHQQP